MPDIVLDIIKLFAALLRFLGLLVFGAGTSWLTLDLLKKSTVPYAQIAFFLGFLGLTIALTVFTAAGGLAGFVLGAGLVLLFQFLPKKGKEED